MSPQEFKNILVSFADNPHDILTDKNDLLIKIRDEIITITLLIEGNILKVKENGSSYEAVDWIMKRLSKTFQLADRILEYIKPEEYFISPAGKLNDDLEKNPDDKSEDVKDLIKCLKNTINVKEALVSKVIYLTSDAGEGKSTIINELARIQAEKYKKKETDWLLLPIPLGGRPFLRLDDVIIASLVNKYRFPNLYYDSFIELVKLGIIVPALDGFEEMFMESSTGEAFSSLGQLMNKLSSLGTVVIAARKAYFDIKNLSIQAKLYDTLGSNNVLFSKISIDRWGKEQFIQYANKRHVKDAEKTFENLANALQSAEHSILTRAVLVKQLFEVFQNVEGEIDIDVSKIIPSETDKYFTNFINAILEREANKWIDRSGEPYKPLLTVEEHQILLSLIAQEMWIGNNNQINADVLEFVVDLFSENEKINTNVHRQIKDKIKLHALLVNVNMNKNLFSFDHEEFKHHFLGIAIANKIISNELSILSHILQISSLPSHTIKSIESVLKNKNYVFDNILQIYKELCKNESQISFIRENLSYLMLRIITVLNVKKISINNLTLPVNSLQNVVLDEVEIADSYFQGTEIRFSKIKKCTFKNCKFEKIEIDNSNELIDNILDDCEILSLLDSESEHTYYDPGHISSNIQRFSFSVTSSIKDKTEIEYKDADERVILIERLLKRFLKSTYLTENIVKLKLGKKFNEFENDIYPELEKNKVFTMLVPPGASQLRYKLDRPMSEITYALQNSNGNFDTFLKLLKKQHR